MAVWNLLKRYTRSGDLVVDCMAGGGTTIDVARALGRRVIGLDLSPSRPDIVRNDARHLPFEDDSVDFHFVDSPYSDNIRYSGDGRCIGKIPANTERFSEEIAKVATEIHRTLKRGKYAAWVISDEYRRGRYTPVGFKVHGILAGLFEPVDTVVMVRHNDSGANPMWEHKARERNFFLRGFKYLFIMRKMAVEG
jgi:DNA modification methylase